MVYRSRQAANQYPVDEKGFPYQPWDIDSLVLDEDILALNSWNNHHQAFYKREFAKTAITQTFRDLENMQTMLPRIAHDRLHRNYVGISIPPIENMIERIEEAKENSERLKIYNVANGCYEYSSITEGLWASLMQEYNQSN